MNLTSIAQPRQMRGFTMIELIVVIVILGILATVAVPRFINLQRDARVAKLNAARGAVQAAAAMVHSAAQARAGQGTIAIGGCTATMYTSGSGTICTENGSVPVINWYPYANLPGIISAAGLTSVFPATGAALTAEGYSISGGGAAINSTLTVRVTGGTDPTNCSFTYSPSTGGVLGSGANISPVVTTGC